MENCFPPTSLFSTENTANFELVGRNWGGGIVTGPFDYYVCTVYSEGSCGALFKDFDFIVLPKGTSIELDGFAASHDPGPTADKAIFFRGKIDEKTVWISFRAAMRLDDPINENSFRQFGGVRKDGEDVGVYSWRCPNRKWYQMMF